MPNPLVGTVTLGGIPTWLVDRCPGHSSLPLVFLGKVWPQLLSPKTPLLGFLNPTLCLQMSAFPAATGHM